MTKKKKVRRKPNSFRHPIKGPFDRVSIDCSQDGLTKQEFKDDCDINKIMDKYQRTGVINHLAKHGEQYGEIVAADLMEAHLISEQAGVMFRELPSSLRNRFNGSPVEFLEFVQNPENRDEMIEMGLMEKPRETLKPPETTSAGEPPPEVGTGESGAAEGASEGA